MHPLAALNEAELGSLTRVADRLLNTRHLLAPGHRPNRRRAGAGIEFLDYRQYTAGDDIRAIDWRVSARSRHPQIRRYSDEAAADWFILLDCSASMAFGQGEKWSLAVQCAAAMAYLLIHLDNRVSILLFNQRVEQRVPLGRGYAHYARLLQTLRATTPPASGGGSALDSCIAHIKRDSPAFVISDFLREDSMQPALAALAMRSDHLHAMQILTQAEYQLPKLANATFRDVESGQTVNAVLDASARQAYRQSFEQLGASLSAYCASQQIRFSRHDTDEHWKNVLARHLQPRSSAS